MNPPNRSLFEFIGLILGLFIGIFTGVLNAIILASIIGQFIGVSLTSLLMVPALLASFLNPIISLFSSFIVYLQATSLFMSFIFLFLMILVQFFITIVFYVLARISYNIVPIGTVDRPNGGCEIRWWEPLCRSTLAATNVMINTIVLVLLLPSGLLGLYALIGLPLCFTFIARGVYYQILIAWISYLLPTALPNTFLGLVFALVNELMSLLFSSASFSILKRDFDWRTGSFVISGGIVIDFNVDGYTLGHFVFINRDRSELENFGPQIEVDTNTGILSAIDKRTNTYLVVHETGHTLNAATFGYAFTVIGGIDQMFLSPDSFNISGGVISYAELLAESHARKIATPPNGSDGFWLPYWGEMENVRPQVITDSVVTGLVNMPIRLTAALSMDDTDNHPGLPLTFLWTRVNANLPLGNTIVLTATDMPAVTFIPDVTGEYFFTVLIHDGIDNSPPGNVSVIVS